MGANAAIVVAPPPTHPCAAPADWNWAGATGPPLPIWVWANQPGGSVELFLNGASLGRKAMPTWGHAEWTGVPWAAGSLHAVVYSNASATVPVAEVWRNTTGPAAGLRISIKDGVGGAGVVAGCQDAALVQVEVVDAAGTLVPTATNNVTFAITGGPGRLEGTANGDPACHVNNKSPVRPAYHGLVMAVVLAPSAGATGAITVSASSPGFPPVTLDIPVQATPPAGAKWCRNEAAL